MNHRWKDNKCIHCGIKRQRKEWRRKHFYSGVRHGIWQDIPFYKYGIGYYYGDTHKFKRPDCVKPVTNTKQFKGITKEEILRFAPVLNKLAEYDKNPNKS